MNNEIMFFIGVILGSLIVLFEMVKLIKIDRIEKKYVKSVEVVCLYEEPTLSTTIHKFEIRGWLVSKIEPLKQDTKLCKITFVK